LKILAGIPQILLISLAGRRARVLEAYFEKESKSLVMRYSDLYGLYDRTLMSNMFKTFAKVFSPGSSREYGLNLDTFICLGRARRQMAWEFDLVEFASISKFIFGHYLEARFFVT
jgi:hypothetical protein